MVPIGYRGHISNLNLLDLVEVDSVAGAVAEFRHLRRFVSGDGQDMLDGTTAHAVGGDGQRALKGWIYISNFASAHDRILSPVRLP
jgi:hypothetical protein